MGSVDNLESSLGCYKNHQPLSQEICDTFVLVTIKPLNMEKFDGKMDPLEQLMALGTLMEILGAPEPLKCKLLSDTLKDVTLIWYMNLPSHFILGMQIFITN